MQSLPRVRWLGVLALAALLLVALSFARPWLLADARDRLTQKYHQRIASLSERQAALLVRRLAKSDAHWLDVLVAAAADDRKLVAAAAETELREMVDRWAEHPPERSTAVADLARLLAEQAPALPAERRHLAHSLAQRLLDWPVNGQFVDAAQLIADCQTVLLLPRVEPAEIRVAAVSAKADQGRDKEQDQPTIAAEPPPAAVEPSPPATSSPTDQRAPQPFQPVSPMRISDE